MKKIAILTFTHVYNYGNSLQNYALQQIIREKLGMYPETIIYESKGGLQRAKDYFMSLCKRDRDIIRKRKFRKFEKKYINISPFKNLCSYNDEAEKRYDYYVVGSDQIWNPYWFTDVFKNAYLLTFTDKIKKIAYSASFGVDEIPEEWKQFFIDNLSDFENISVREESGAKIVRELTGKECDVIIDPTLLISDDEWRVISQKPKQIKQKDFVLAYFLSPKCSKAKEQLRTLSKQYEVVDLGENKYKTCDPLEFLWLFDNAQIILTDSFHASVFSFVFNNPFIVYDRQYGECNMNSRLKTLLLKFKIERKYAESEMANDIWEHDYSKGYEILKEEQEKAFKYLRNSLK